MSMTIILLGSLVQDGKKNAFPTAYAGGSFDVVDTDGMRAIPWLVAGEKLFCCYNLLHGISWKALERNHKVFGCQANIDGFSFQCRIPTPGMAPGGEWDAAIDLVKGDDLVLHWKDHRSWCQRDGSEPKTRVVRGGGLAKEWTSFPEAAFADWRPVLEPCGVPIPGADTGFHLRAGYELMVWGDGCVLRGKLLDQSKYDLILQSSGNWFADDTGPLFRTIPGKDKKIIVDKSQIKLVQIGRFVGL